MLLTGVLSVKKIIVLIALVNNVNIFVSSIIKFF